MGCVIKYKGQSIPEEQFLQYLNKQIAINNLFNENESLVNAVYEALGFTQQNDFKQTFENSLWRGQESKPYINENGDLVLTPTYDTLFKSEGISFAENIGIAQAYGERYSKNPFIVEIDENYADKIYPLDRQGTTKSYGKRVVGDENEQRFISKEEIIIPKGKFKIHKKELIYDFSKTSTLNLVDEWAKQFIETDIAEFNRYGESSQGYVTEDEQYYTAVENELKDRGVTNEELLFLKPANPIEGEEIIKEAFNIEDVTQKDIDAFLKKQKELQQKYYNKELDVKDSFGFKKSNVKISKELQLTPQQKQQAQQLYSQYLDTVFPDSKVKEIVYHGTDAEFEKFDTAKGKWSNAIFFSFKKRDYKRKKEIPVIVNVFNKFNIDTYIDKKYGVNTVKTIIEERYTGEDSNPNATEEYYNLYAERNPDTDYEQFIKSETIKEYQKYGFDYLTPQGYLAVFEPEQIHILGSKQDIEGFKKFVGKSSDNLSTQINDLYTQYQSQLTEKGVSLEDITQLVEEFGIEEATEKIKKCYL